ncbi:hypothetical protein CRYUN_Cryun09bG0176500 [Craigia yunnanensis]
MERNWCFSYLAILFLSVAFSASLSTSISDGVLSSLGSTSRNLLQMKKACPIAFEFLNYTIITSQCKAPQYPADRCCAAFKKFACPFAKQINDQTTDCASTMFSYINLYGKYPPGLFASKCQEGKGGLKCPASPPVVSATANTNAN